MEVLTNPDKHLVLSRNEYDWLGTGAYFWENDCDRAMQFAEQGVGGRVTKGKIKKPFVIGAIIDLGLCCNLFDQLALRELRRAYDSLKDTYEYFGFDLPDNGKGQLLRPLDRMVIEHMHDLREKAELAPYQSVRSGFAEGGALFPGTELTKKAHIQIAVRDLSCIKGYFLPRL